MNVVCEMSFLERDVRLNEHRTIKDTLSDGLDQWFDGEIITIKLDCDKNAVKYFKNYKLFI